MTPRYDHMTGRRISRFFKNSAWKYEYPFKICKLTFKNPVYQQNEIS